MDCSITELARKLESKNEMILKNITIAKYNFALSLHKNFIKFVPNS
ncbi:hypothetical protein PSYMP_27808 [Pseudomonas amygdali pv. morsprunorum str. M302280]|nr:hypothetical protein PSYMP_27808 [Pseudomonas amygdali pv. morsprunorum str. M302280]